MDPSKGVYATSLKYNCAKESVCTSKDNLNLIYNVLCSCVFPVYMIKRDVVLSGTQKENLDLEGKWKTSFQSK